MWTASDTVVRISTSPRGGKDTRASLKIFGLARPLAFTKWTARSTSNSCDWREVLRTVKATPTRPPIATRAGSKRTPSIETDAFRP